MFIDRDDGCRFGDDRLPMCPLSLFLGFKYFKYLKYMNNSIYN